MEEKMFLEKDLSYKLMGCFYKVRNTYGSGLREKFYDQVLGEILSLEGLQFVEKPRVPLYSVQTGKVISFSIPDKLVADKIIIELKAKPFMSRDDIGQATEYLRITPYEILYLVNFGEQNFKPRRIICTNDRKSFLSKCVTK